MNNVVVFKNDSFNKSVRVVYDGDIPMFVGRDVCEFFGDTNYRRSLSKLDDDEKGVSQIDTAGGAQKMTVINESGLYSLLFTFQPQKGNNDKSAKDRSEMLSKFKRWVTHDVLPTLRKTGHYELPHMSKQQILIATLQEQEKLSKRMDKVEHTVTNVLTIDSGKQRYIQKEIAKRVLDRLQQVQYYSGFDYDEKKDKRTLFAQIHRDIKDRFAVASYRDVKVVDYDACIGYIKNWVESRI